MILANKKKALNRLDNYHLRDLYYGVLNPNNPQKEIFVSQEKMEEISNIVYNAFKETNRLDELEKLCDTIPHLLDEPNIVNGTIKLKPNIPSKD